MNIMIQIKSKDELRVERSIQSIMKKISDSLERSMPRCLVKERAFEQSCYDKGLIYFPSTSCSIKRSCNIPRSERNLKYILQIIQYH